MRSLFLHDFTAGGCHKSKPMASDTIVQGGEADDRALLRRYVSARSEEAFAALVQRHLALVYNVALRKVGGDTHLAEDVVQRVFAALATKAATLQRHPTVAGWLFTGTHYAAAQLVRTERRRKAREQKAHAMSEPSQESTATVDWQHLRPLLDDLVLALPQRDREAVLLRYFEGLPFAEVGVRLQLTDHGARARVERAVEKLRTMLSRQGITSTSAILGLALAHQTTAAAPAGLAAVVTGTALSIATATGGTAGAIGFMSTAKLLTTGATLVTLSAIGFGVLQQQRSRAAIEEAATLRQERALLVEQLARAEQRAKQSESQNLASTQKLPDAPAAPLKTSSTTTPAATISSPAEPAMTALALEATKQVLAVVNNAGGQAMNALDREHLARVRAWVEQDPSDLIRWIATLPSGRQREHTTEAVIAIATETNPEFAFLLTGGIARDLPRMNRRSEVIRAWAPRDTAAATRAVTTADLSAIERDRLLSIIATARPKR
jgi:RNA polymerase sigma factor (sigma-70 family)